ncbi:MAG TPA: flagellar filament capping protein FliD [Gemmata sp.]|jgi:flagellar hook-associated protein 2|nr:flagellar filament capping protein FliD [Gemmata sp.]
MSALSVGSSTSNNLTAQTPSSSSSSSSNSPLSFTGLASGIDTSSIITGLEALANKQITALQTQGQGYANIQSAFSTIQSDLTLLLGATSQLSLSAGGAFNGFTATPSDTNALTATAGTAAVPGTYSLTIDSLAQSEQVASQGFADPNTTLQQGTMNIQVGSGTPVTVTLNSQNNTLQGLATAINAAGGGVQASIINDGSSSPYRLMLTATTPGAANTISVTNNLTGAGASINPTQTTVQAASNAQITLGSGTGALNVTSGTNQVTGLIPGVSLNLLQANPNQPVTLTVANDSSGAATAVQSFVTAYNAVVDFINQNSTFNASTQQGGLLLGNATSQNLSNALASALSVSVGGSASGVNSLASVGLSFNQSGDLEFNQATLTQAMNSPGGATAVNNLFAMSGTSTNPGIQFIYGSSNTQPSNGTPYQVQITAPATRGAMTASTALAASTTITNSNNSFTLNVNGLTSSPIALTAGTYDPTQLAAMMQQQINASSSLNGNLVAVSVNGSGELQITSQAYGSASQVSIGTGSAIGASGPLGFAGTESGAGTNVAGDFVVNGQVEQATGTGQFLTGNSGNANTNGLEVQSTLSSAGTAKLTVSQGLAGQLNQVLNEYLNPTTGQLATVNNQYQTQINNINTQITTDNTQLQTQTTNLTNQFAAMEQSVSNLKNVQSLLSGLVSTSTTSTTIG